MDFLSIVEIKELITNELTKAMAPDCLVETELQRLFTEPEGKIVVMYNSSVYNESSNVSLLNRLQRGKFTIMLTVRDPLQAELALQHLEKIRETIHGLRVGPADIDRLYPENDRFEEFTEGSEVWAYKIDVGFSRIARITEENANA
jgi:hypothetical protein